MPTSTAVAPTSKTLQQTNPSNGQLICVAPGTPAGTDVFMLDCGLGAALTVTRGAAAPTGVPFTFKNKAKGQCVLLSKAGAVSMGDCASSDARLKLNAAGQLPALPTPGSACSGQSSSRDRPMAARPATAPRSGSGLR